MKAVAISQRIDHFPDRAESRDAVDTRWGAILWSLGLLPVALCNAVAEPELYVRRLAPDRILLTGGNSLGTAPARDALETALLKYAAETRTPVLGVCRGLQMINAYQGGGAQSIQGHVAVRHVIRGAGIEGTRTVNSFHEFAVTPASLGAGLHVTAEAEDGTVEAFRHSMLPWAAVMWHPEREEVLDVADRKMIELYLGGHA